MCLSLSGLSEDVVSSTVYLSRYLLVFFYWTQPLFSAALVRCVRAVIYPAVPVLGCVLSMRAILSVSGTVRAEDVLPPWISGFLGETIQTPLAVCSKAVRPMACEMSVPSRCPYEPAQIVQMSMALCCMCSAGSAITNPALQ